MALLAYAYLKGQKSGQVKGGITQKGREDSIGVIAVSHAIVSPRDPQAACQPGSACTNRSCSPRSSRKSSPILYNILCTNENLPEAVFKFWTPQQKAATGAGAEVQHYTIKLTNANIASMEFHQANIKHPDLQRLVEYEDIALTYQKIEWTWNDGGITAGDDWEVRN